jgi:ElaB/YqjD/DUF883 family membrane-anchored ribosome-binding protein
MPKKLQNGIEELKETIIDNLNSTKEKCNDLNDLLEEAEDNLKEYACDAQKYLTNSIKKHPLKTLGIAALIGFGIAHLWRK